MSISLTDNQHMSIDEGSVPNLKDLLLPRQPNQQQQDYINKIDMIKNILAEKLRRNLQSSFFLPVMVGGASAGGPTASANGMLLNMQ